MKKELNAHEIGAFECFMDKHNENPLIGILLIISIITMVITIAFFIGGKDPEKIGFSILLGGITASALFFCARKPVIKKIARSKKWQERYQKKILLQTSAE
jgi:hypothetical protein